MSEFRANNEEKFPIRKGEEGKYATINLVEDQDGWVPGMLAKTTDRATSDLTSKTWSSAEEFKETWEEDFNALRLYFSDYLPEIKLSYKEGRKYADDSVDVEQTVYMPVISRAAIGAFSPKKQQQVRSELNDFFGQCVKMYAEYSREVAGKYLPDLRPSNLIYGFDTVKPQGNKFYIIDVQPALVSIISNRVKGFYITFIERIVEKYSGNDLTKIPNAKKLIDLLSN